MPSNKAILALPVATTEYDELNESITRRQLEQSILDMEVEIRLLKDMNQSVTSRSIRRHQFLLMGAR